MGAKGTANVSGECTEWSVAATGQAFSSQRRIRWSTRLGREDESLNSVYNESHLVTSLKSTQI
jgi:hypothetical protein